jgi:hypothetical protein
MKTASTTAMMPTAPSKAKFTPTGRFPKRVNTVIAEALADLIEGRRLTGMSAVFDASTTRLSHHVHALGKVHGWWVETFEKVVGTNDGRVQTIVEYFLSTDVIEAAFKQDAREWITRVRAARRARRAKAAEARRAAERANAAAAAARRRAQPGQHDLFAGATA